MSKKSLFVYIILLVIIAGLAGLLWWCWFTMDHKAPGAPAEAPAATASTGPCKDGTAENILPTGYVFYENTTLGFKFAYPTAWGAVTITTTPMGGSAGEYLRGTFSANADVWFGGNATNYVVNARGGMPTDNPGYLVATNKYYSVQLMKFSSGSGPVEDRHDLYPITEASMLKETCNIKSLVTSYPFTEFDGYAYDLARMNLQPDNTYYGVNFVLKNPNAASKADFDKIVTSFQLIP